MPQIHKNNIRVVIVDDSHTMRNLLASIWSQAGMNMIAIGKNGKDAVKYLGDVKMSSPKIRTGEQ